MNTKDKQTVSEALSELFGVTGPECEKAHREQWAVMDRIRNAEEEMQARFRPHWARIIGIIRRECNKRGVSFTANHSGYQGVEYVRVDKQPSDVSAVGINHTDYTVSPYISIEFWLGYGIKIGWSGYAKTANEFERKFDVLLSTLDGYCTAARKHGKDCDTCGLREKDKGKCQRCRTCKDGSMWT
jgi:RNA binding exosome subunit